MDSHRVNASTSIRVLLIDDHPAVRQGLCLLLAPEDILVCSEGSGSAEGLAHLENKRHDLAIVDLSLDGEDGLALVAELHARSVPVLVYSMHSDAKRVRGAIEAGALGYVVKREFQRVLVHAIREVSAGRRFISPCAAAALADGFTEFSADGALRKLSAHERRVYELLGQGADTLEIATSLRISSHTVESYYARILLKLNLKGMHELRRHAIDHSQKHAG